MPFAVDCAREDDGRWLAQIAQLPGVGAYGGSADGAIAKAQLLAVRVLGERIEQGESEPDEITILLPAAA